MRTPESRPFFGSKRPEKTNKRPSLIEAASILTILATLGLTGKDALKAKSVEHGSTDAVAAEVIHPRSPKKPLDLQTNPSARRDSTQQTEITDEERAQRLMTNLEEHLRGLFPKIRPDVQDDAEWRQTYQRSDDVLTELSIARQNASAGSFLFMNTFVHDGTYVYRAEFTLKNDEFSFNHLKIFDDEGAEDLDDRAAGNMRLNVPADQMQSIPADTQARVMSLVLQGLKEWEQNIEDGRWSLNSLDNNT